MSESVIADLAGRLLSLVGEPGAATNRRGVGDALRREYALEETASREADSVGAASLGTASQELATTETLQRLARAFGLTPFERDLAVLVGLPEEHEDLARAARILHPRGEPRICLPVVVAVLGLDAAGRRHLRSALEVGPLRTHGVVWVDSGVPLPEAGLRLATGLWSVLRGHDHWPEGLRLLAPPVVAAAAPTVAHLARELDAPRRLDASRQLVVVTGGASRSPEELAGMVRGAAVATGTSLAAVAAEGLEGEQEILLSVHAAVRGAVPVLVGRPARAPLARHPGPVVVCIEDPSGLRLDDRPVVTVDAGPRLLGESLAMWQALVPGLNGGAELLASVLRLDHVQAVRAVTDAGAASPGPVTVEGVLESARRRTASDLPASGRLVRPTAGWDALVTSADNTSQLHSIIGRVRGQVRVLHEWGFGARVAPGVRALFSGPPGTGKTLSAHIVASSLGLDLLVVDVSGLVSKWLGETEKNISAIFDAAERSQAVLFFDEADAVFGQRTDSGDAQARWANLETAHLLARVDSFEGLVLLATNLRGHIDNAFVRRLDVIVEFDEPDAGERLRLWQTHLPATAPLAPDVDLGQLAALYDVTGGLIRNAALTAAYRAAAEGRPIGHDHLLDAVAREYQKAGRSFPGRPRRPAGIASGGE